MTVHSNRVMANGDMWVYNGPTLTSQTAHRLPANLVKSFTDADLVFELLERGYQISKPPVGE